MRVLVTGAGGQLGSVLPGALDGHEVLALDRAALDLADREAVEAVVASFAPHAVVNAAALTNVDRCETDPAAAYAANARGVRFLAVAASRVGAHVVHVSTDYVFDGRSRRPYHEFDPVAPIQEYGRSKRAGEVELERHAASWAVARTSWVFGRRGGDFVSWCLASTPDDVRPVLDDQVSRPTYAPDLAAVLARIAVERIPGVFHVANRGECNRYQLAVDALALVGRDDSTIRRVSGADLARPAARPAYSAMRSLALEASGVPEPRDYRDALGEYLARERAS